MATFSGLKLSINRIELPQGPGRPIDVHPQYTSVERVGGYLYVVGQLHVRNGTDQAIGVLDIRRRRWLGIPYEGRKVVDPRMFLFADSLYAIARVDWRGSPFGKVSRFDLIEEEWSDCNTTGEVLQKRSYCSGDFVEKHNCFVVFGGDRANKDVHVLSMPERRWLIANVKGQSPTGRYSHGSCVYQDVLYYYGGWSQGNRQNDGVFMLTFTSTNVATWSVVKDTVDKHLRLSSFAMLPFKGKILLCGGASVVRHGLSIYDPKTHVLEHARVEEPHVSAGRFYVAGLKAFTIDEGHSFGLIAGGTLLTCYHYVSIIEEQ